MRNITILALAGLFSTGCGGPGNAWDGTWLVAFAGDGMSQTGDCVDPDDTGDEYVNLGEQRAFIDVVTTAEGTFAVNIDDMILTGTEEGGQVVVSALEGWEYGEEFERTTYTMTLTRNGGSLSGTMRILEEEHGSSYYGATDYTCDTQMSFTGERVTSPSDELVAPGGFFP